MSDTKPTGRVMRHWVEYEETPYMHNTGYFWLRSDGLRFGLRLAGDYYRPGTTPEAVRDPFHPFDFPPGDPRYERLVRFAPAGSYWDGAVAFDVQGDMRERSKKERLPTHLRIMRDGRELELISQIDGHDLEEVLKRPGFCPFQFLDTRYPIQRTVNAKSG